MKKITMTTKRLTMILAIMLTMVTTGRAMSYEQARNEALFLTDKMAYELNLTDAQYEAAYEINLDYLMGVTSYDDVYGTYWERRNLDLSYILLDWQWNAFRAATYFYRPLYWRDGFWHFGIYARYPHRDYFYFGRPVFYASYRGGHAWHIVGGHGYYYGRRDHFRPVAGKSHFGMLDRWNRGDYRNHHHTALGSRDSHFGGNRNSSTRTTVRGGHNYGHNEHGSNATNHQGTERSSLGGYRSHSGSSTAGQSSSTNNSHSATNSHNSLGGNRTTGNQSSYSGSRSSGSFGNGSLGGSRSSGSFGNGSLGGSRSSGSFGSGATRSSSHSSGSGAGRSSGGGRSYGGRR